MTKQEIALKRTVADFSKQMNLILQQKRKEGKVGWDNPCYSIRIATDLAMDSVDIFRNMLNGDLNTITEKDCIDVSNRAMMLWNMIRNSPK